MAEKNQKRRERGLSVEIIDLEKPKRRASSGALIDLIATDNGALIDLTATDDNEKNPISGVKVIEVGDSSGSKKKKTKVEESFVCEICVETKAINEAFKIKGCGHSYCSECMVRYVVSKVQENIILIVCPEMNCQRVLEPESCQSILPPEVFDRWGKALCEALILGTQKFYCPFKDCSALLHDEGGGKISQSECPHCNRLVCALCKVPWHTGIKCEEFQKLNVEEREREDIMFMEAAKANNWRRCPKCKFFIEKTVGCSTIRCRCGQEFCYSCGSSSVTGDEHSFYDCNPSLLRLRLKGPQQKSSDWKMMKIKRRRFGNGVFSPPWIPDRARRFIISSPRMQTTNHK